MWRASKKTTSIFCRVVSCHDQLIGPIFYRAFAPLLFQAMGSGEVLSAPAGSFLIHPSWQQQPARKPPPPPHTCGNLAVCIFPTSPNIKTNPVIINIQATWLHALQTTPTTFNHNADNVSTLGSTQCALCSQAEGVMTH